MENLKQKLQKGNYLNLITSIVVFFVNIFINLWLSPYIIKTIGVEANGFVSLANNFILYANLIVTALNGMAARFITIEYSKGNYKKANLYYNSVFWGNLIIVAILILPAIGLIVYCQNIFQIPANLLTDIKLLFAFILFGFFLKTGMPNWEVGTYVKNRLDRDYLPEIFIQIIRVVLIVGSMTLFEPKVWYVGCVTLIIAVLKLVVQAYNTRTLTPELKLVFKNNKPLCSKNVIKQLVGSGIWNSVSGIGNILLTGLDLIICNAMLGASAMGVLSLSKTLTLLLQQFSSSITTAFAPDLIISLSFLA